LTSSALTFSTKAASQVSKQTTTACKAAVAVAKATRTVVSTKWDVEHPKISSKTTINVVTKTSQIQPEEISSPTNKCLCLKPASKDRKV